MFCSAGTFGKLTIVSHLATDHRFTVVLALHLFANHLRVQWAYLAMLGTGSFCFGAMGIALGLLCRTQASARTFGVIIYLPLFLPAALSDTSQHLRAIAPFLPSYAFYEPVQAIILEHGRATGSPVECLILVAVGAATCLVAHRLIRVRWLM